MLTGKQRAFLRALANPMDAIVIVGKDGVTDNVVRQVSDALEARELIKGSVLESAMLTAREVSDRLCDRCGCDAVQCIGSKFVLYRRNVKEPKIDLPAGKKR
jgi:RNA-binding protein